jgi:hypothetical protein
MYACCLFPLWLQSKYVVCTAALVGALPLQVPYAHKDLSSGLDLSGYTNELHEVMSIQTCSTQQQQQQQQQQPAAAGSTGSIGSNSSTGMELSSIGSTNSKGSSATDQLNRLAGRDAAYAFVFPTLMVNRYGKSSDLGCLQRLAAPCNLTAT